MACNGDDLEPEGKVNHWCNVSGELLALAVESGVKPKRGAPSTAPLCKLHTVPSHDTHTHRADYGTAILRRRQHNLCLWIMNIPSKWRPIYAHTTLSSIYFYRGYDSMAGGFIDNWLLLIYLSFIRSGRTISGHTEPQLLFMSEWRARLLHHSAYSQVWCSQTMHNVTQNRIVSISNPFTNIRLSFYGIIRITVKCRETW